jgi:hypothetical protein
MAMHPDPVAVRLDAVAGKLDDLAMRIGRGAGERQVKT